MLKMLGIGFAVLVVALIAFSFFGDRHPEALHSAPIKLGPVDHALGLCEEWTRANSKLAMGDIVEERKITGANIPATHGLVEIDYRSKPVGVLMQARCEYAPDGSGSSVLVNAKSSLK
jgi:hypothetical protein